MENKFDSRKKLARAAEQEYAHQYTPKTREESYQYEDEESRVTYHVHDEDDTKTTEELYNIQPEQIIDTSVNNKIKAIVDTREVTEDHRQRSYKIKTQPQIYTKTDVDIDTMQNQNDPRQDEIDKLRETSKSFSEQINKEQNTDLTNPVERFSIEEKPKVDGEDDCEIVFNVGDNVTHAEEDIDGEIKFVNDKRVAVVWEDNTRERFALKEAKEFLKLKKKAYVGDVQEQVDPVHTPDWPKNEELEKKIDNALSSLENEDEITAEEIDLEKIKLQRKLNELESKVNEIDVEKIKTKAANDLISLMQKKGLLSEDEEEVTEQFNNIVAMNDEAFETFKKAIISTKKSAAADEDEIYAILGEDDDFSDIEDGSTYAKMREQVKQESKSSRSVDGIEMGDTSFFENGGLSNFKGNIGDFSATGGLTSSSSNQNETRSLKASGNRKPIEKKSSGLDMSGFQDLQGLTTPINIPNKDLSVRGKFADLFDGMGWSGVPKK